MKIKIMAPACGAIVTGIDLAASLTDRQFNDIHSAFLERTVLIFRDLDLSEDQHVAFARRFGAAQNSEVSAFGKNADHPEIDILEYDANNPPVGTRDLWHTDFAGTERADPRHVALRPRHPARRDTIWVSSGRRI